MASLPAIARAQSSNVTELFTMHIGEMQTRSSAGVSSYSTSGPGIVEVRFVPDSSNFLFDATAPGQTIILLVFQDGHQVRCLFTVTA